MKDLNLLLIDDEIEILQILTVIFQKYVKQVLTANSGLLALDLLDKNKIDCVICDINMPKMTGIEVIKKIREMGNDVPIIIYTAYGNYDLMLEAGKYGVYDFINKPDMNQLKEVTLSALKSGIRLLYGVDNQEVTEDNISEYQRLLRQMK